MAVICFFLSSAPREKSSRMRSGNWVPIYGCASRKPPRPRLTLRLCKPVHWQGEKWANLYGTSRGKPRSTALGRRCVGDAEKSSSPKTGDRLQALQCQAPIPRVLRIARQFNRPRLRKKSGYEVDEAEFSVPRQSLRYGRQGSLAYQYRTVRSCHFPHAGFGPFIGPLNRHRKRRALSRPLAAYRLNLRRFQNLYPSRAPRPFP